MTWPSHLEYCTQRFALGVHVGYLRPGHLETERYSDQAGTLCILLSGFASKASFQQSPSNARIATSANDIRYMGLAINTKHVLNTLFLRYVTLKLPFSISSYIDVLESLLCGMFFPPGTTLEGTLQGPLMLVSGRAIVPS